MRWLSCDGHLRRIVVLEGIRRLQLRPIYDQYLSRFLGIGGELTAATQTTMVPTETMGCAGILFFDMQRLKVYFGDERVGGGERKRGSWSLARQPPLPWRGYCATKCDYTAICKTP